MKESKTIMNEKELELGKYLEADMLEISEDDVANGGAIGISAVVSFVSAFISSNTCPSTVCTRAC